MVFRRAPAWYDKYYRTIPIGWQTTTTEFHAHKGLTRSRSALQATLTSLQWPLTALHFLLIMRRSNNPAPSQVVARRYRTYLVSDMEGCFRHI